MTMTRNGLVLALEAEQATGKSQDEIEHVFYARVADFKQFEGMAKERQEQWEIKIPKTEYNTAAGSIRVRKTTEDGKPPVYIMTSKVIVDGNGKLDEVPIASTSVQFIHFAVL